MNILAKAIVIHPGFFKIWYDSNEGALFIMT